MALLNRRACLAVTAAAWLFGCAAEDWNNRFDPASKAYRKPCADAPAGETGDCVFWEEFDHGLVHWLVDPAPSGQSAIRILASDPSGKVPTVLALPGCPGAAAVARTEISVASSSVFLTITWQAAPKNVGQLAVTVGGERIDLETTDSTDFRGWRESFAEIPTQGGRDAVVGLFDDSTGGDACGVDGLYVARVSLRKPAN